VARCEEAAPARQLGPAVSFAVARWRVVASMKRPIQLVKRLFEALHGLGS
jgi:hypothetical protein